MNPLEIFNQYAYATATEVIQQQVRLFNSASRGAIVLRGGANQGDFSDVADYKLITGVVRRRNAHGTGAVTAKDMDMLLRTSVKVAAGTPPINIPPDFWNWIQRSPDEAGAVIGQQVGEATLQDMLNMGIKAASAAMLNVGATVVYDGSAAGPTQRKLNRGAALFGDRSARIACWVMHSATWTEVFDTALANQEQLYRFGDVAVMQDPLGRPFIVTDSADLINTSPSPDQYHTLGLVPGAIIIERNNDFEQNTETTNGDENILRTYQAQWSANLGIRGYAWDKAGGGASPNDAAIGTGTNWDKVSTDIKDTAGVLIKTL